MSLPPSSLSGSAGFFDLTVKRYKTGVISKYLHNQRMGDIVPMSDPHPDGHWVDGMAKKVGFVAAGTGITPMISIIRWILARRLDADCFWFLPTRPGPTLFFETSGDGKSERVRTSHCYPVLGQPPAGRPEGIRRITAEILRRHLPLRAAVDG